MKKWEMTDRLFPTDPDFDQLSKEQQTADHRKRFEKLKSFIRRHRKRIDEEKQRQAAAAPSN